MGGLGGGAPLSLSLNLTPQQAQTVAASLSTSLRRRVTSCHLIDRVLCAAPVGRCRSRSGPGCTGRRGALPLLQALDLAINIDRSVRKGALITEPSSALEKRGGGESMIAAFRATVGTEQRDGRIKSCTKSNRTRAEILLWC